MRQDAFFATEHLYGLFLSFALIVFVMINSDIFSQNDCSTVLFSLF